MGEFSPGTTVHAWLIKCALAPGLANVGGKKDFFIRSSLLASFSWSVTASVKDGLEGMNFEKEIWKGIFKHIPNKQMFQMRICGNEFTAKVAEISGLATSLKITISLWKT